MTNAMVKDAKNMYIETGRLNRNIINKEISISWYKCKLQNLDPKGNFKKSGDPPAIGFEPKFLSYIETIVPVHYDYILVNMSLQKCSARMHLSSFNDMDTIDDLAIGTNGGYLAYKSQTNQLVSQDEHYLDRLCDYFSFGIVVTQSDKMLGVLMLLSTEKPNEYDIVKIREKLLQYNLKTAPIVAENTLSFKSEFTLQQLFAYPEAFMSEFKQNVEKSITNPLPTLIKGTQGSGKSTLSRFLGDFGRQAPFILCLNETPRIFHKYYLEKGMSQYDTVIIESIEHAEPELLNLLTVYTEAFALGKFSEKHSNYSCSKMILTTTYTDNYKEQDSLSRLQIKQLNKLIDRLKLNTVNLVNTDWFVNEMNQLNELISILLSKNGVRATDMYKVKLKEYIKGHSFKNIQKMIEISIDEAQLTSQETLDIFPLPMSETIMSLEDNERAYIMKIYERLDHNMSATANVLNIGRSTLYRKLEKYQNDTK